MGDLRARRDRVRRAVAKRPPTITVEVTCAPKPGRRELLIELLIELLDEQRRGTR